MKAVKPEDEKLSTKFTVCFKSFDETLMAINDNTDIISDDEILYLSDIIPDIKSKLDTVLDEVDARLKWLEGESTNTLKTSPYKSDSDRLMFHKSSVNLSKQKTPPSIQNKTDSKKHRQHEEHEAIEINENREETNEIDSSSTSNNLQIVSNYFSTSAPLNVTGNRAANVSSIRPRSADPSAPRKEYRRTIFPGAKNTDKSFSESSDTNISDKWVRIFALEFSTT